jgi:hypothetical protein
MRKSDRWGAAIGALLCTLLGPVRMTRAQAASPAPTPPAAAEPATSAAPESDPVDPVFEIERIEPPPSSTPLPAPPATTVPSAQAYERPPIITPARRADSVPDETPLPPSFRPALALSYALGPLLGIGATALLGPWGLTFFAAPVLVHFAYLDPMGGLITLFAYPATVVAGVLAGIELDTGPCEDGDGFDMCNLDGIVVGGLLGALTWSLIDVLVLAPKTWRGNHPPERSVGIGVLPGGGAGVSWIDRF